MFRRSLLKHGAIASSGLAFGTGLMGLRSDGGGGGSQPARPQEPYGGSRQTGQQDDQQQNQPQDDPQNTGPGKTVEVSVQDSSFNPLVVEAQAGDTIRFTNEGTLTHTVTGYQSANNKPRRCPAGATTIASGSMGGGSTYEVTLNAPGVYDYFCKPHEAQGMVGSIVVRGQGDDDPNQAGLSDPSNLTADTAVTTLQQANARAKAILGITNQGGNQNQQPVGDVLRVPVQSGDGTTVNIQRFTTSQGGYITAQDPEWMERNIEAGTPAELQIGVTDFLESGTHTQETLNLGNNAARLPQENVVENPQEDSLSESGPIGLVVHRNNTDPEEFEAGDLPRSSNTVDTQDQNFRSGHATLWTAYHLQGSPMEACVLNRDVLNNGDRVINDMVYAVDEWMNSNHDMERRLAGVLVGSIAGMDSQVQSAGVTTMWEQELFGPQAPAGPIDGGAGSDAYGESEPMLTIPHQNNTAFGSGFDNDDGAYGEGNKDLDEFPVVNYAYPLLKRGDSIDRQQEVIQACDLAREAMRNPENLVRSTISAGAFLEAEDVQAARDNLGDQADEPLFEGLKLSDVLDSLTEGNIGN
jgi:plastocyanin